jgi:UDP-glucose 4-epimerase
MTLKNVAVVGSNGFIGTHLARKLLQVPGIQLSLFGKNEHCVLGPDLDYHQIDINNRQQVSTLFAGKDIVYYLASGSIPFSTWETPVLEVEKNLIPFLNFMEVMAELKVKKVVFTSSAGTIYGTTDEKAKEDFFKNPYSPHGIVKLTMEYFLNYFRIKNNIDFDVYRIANCYGPGQNTKKGLGLINTFLEKILSEKKIHIFGDGKAIRNYIYAEDLADLMVYSLAAGTSGIYNASSDDHLDINEIIGIIKNVVAEDFDVIYTEKRQSDNPAIYLDNTRIRSEHPDFRFTDIATGIAQTYRHLKEQTNS